MKVLKAPVIASLLSTTFLFAFENDENQSVQDSPSNDLEESQSFTKSKTRKAPTVYEIPFADIEEEVETIVDDTFNATYLTENPNAIATIEPAATPNMMKITIDPDGDGGGPNNPDKIVCEGSGLSFARCVADWFELNPTGCLVIRQDGGTYTADDEGC